MAKTEKSRARLNAERRCLAGWRQLQRAELALTAREEAYARATARADAERAEDDQRPPDLRMRAGVLPGEREAAGLKRQVAMDRNSVATFSEDYARRKAALEALGGKAEGSAAPKKARPTAESPSD